MSDMQLARYTFAIGGAGKELIYNMFGVSEEKQKNDKGEIIRKYVILKEKEWVLRELIRAKPNPTDVDINIIDTAKLEENKDRVIIALLNAKVVQIQNECRQDLSEGRRVGRVNFKYFLLTKGMVLQHINAMVDTQEIERIKKSQDITDDMKIWWMNDDQLGDEWNKKVIDHADIRNMDFQHGVLRKRAIAKALYYKAVTNGIFVPSTEVPTSDNIDIIIGIGGGTGSGIAIDLAISIKKIRNTANITIFGILSTRKEADEKSNSFAMLSELEYISLSKDIFKNIVLIPMEKTQFPGRQRSDTSFDKLLDEFDETFPSILISYHNTGTAQGLFDKVPNYAPFIVANAQVIRYDVVAMKKFKDKLFGIIQDKEKSLENANDIYNTIRNIVNEFYKNGRDMPLSDGDISIIKDRFQKFETLLKHEKFEKLKYNTIIELKKAVEDGMSAKFVDRPDNKADTIEKQVSRVRHQVHRRSVSISNFRDNVDRKLNDIIKKDIEMIDIMKDILGLTNRIYDSSIKDTLNAIIRADDQDTTTGLIEIEEKIKELDSKDKDIENKITTWHNTVRTNIECIILLNSSNSKLKENDIKIKTRLDEYIENIKLANKSRAVDNVQTDVRDILDQNKNILYKIGLEYKDIDPITKSINLLKELKRDYIEYTKIKGILGGSVRIVKGLRSAKEIIGDMDRIRNELMSHKIFSVEIKEKDNSISISISNIYKSNLEDMIDDKKKDKIKNISKETNNIFLPISNTSISNLEKKLKDIVAYQDINVKDIISEISKISEELHKFSVIYGNIKNISQIIGDHADRTHRYNEYIKNIETHINEMYNNDGRTATYALEIQPLDMFGVTGSNVNIADILKDEELIKMKEYLTDGVRRTINVGYNGLAKNTIVVADGKKKWREIRIMNSFMTIATILSPGDYGQEIRDEFLIDIDGRYDNWSSPWGDAWGISTVLFIKGVPLDNIQNITHPEGYYYAYKDTKSIFFHHAYMLETGKLIIRKEIFDFRKEEDKIKLLDDDKNKVEKTFIDNYEEVDIRKCL